MEPSLVTGCALLAAFLTGLLCSALREFSFSELEEICSARGREGRFSEILKRHEDASRVLEPLYAVSLALLGGGILVWLELDRPGLDQLTIAMWLLSLVVLSLLVAVILPWTIGRVAGEGLLFRTWPLIQILLLLGRPYLAIVQHIDRIMHRISGVEEPEEGLDSLHEEIRTVVDEGQREGLLESEARTMIHRVMELSEEDTAAIMTPRTEMVVIPRNASFEEARARLLEAGHSRIPLIGETIDDIVGILYAKDLLRYLDPANGRPQELIEIAREPLYVPETTGIDTLLETMKREHVHVAIVIDEYGGVSGLVTLEDILEEIVGEIVDEYDRAEDEGIYPIDERTVEVEARVHIDDLNERFGYDLPEDGDFDTLGGFVFTQMSRVPKPSESFTWGQLRVTVLEAGERKINRVRIETDEDLAATTAAEG